MRVNVGECGWMVVEGTTDNLRSLRTVTTPTHVRHGSYGILIGWAQTLRRRHQCCKTHRPCLHVFKSRVPTVLTRPYPEKLTTGPTSMGLLWHRAVTDIQETPWQTAEEGPFRFICLQGLGLIAEVIYKWNARETQEQTWMDRPPSPQTETSCACLTWTGLSPDQEK
jgi:hypothetical protein